MVQRIAIKIWYWGPPAAWATAIFTLSCISFGPQTLSYEGQDKVVHVLLFAVLALLLMRAFTAHLKMSAVRAAWLTLFVTSAYGAIDEFHQLFTPARSAEILDWVGDTIGGMAGFAAALLQRKGKECPS